MAIAIVSFLFLFIFFCYTISKYYLEMHQRPYILNIANTNNEIKKVNLLGAASAMLSPVFNITSGVVVTGDAWGLTYANLLQEIIRKPQIIEAFKIEASNNFKIPITISQVIESGVVLSSKTVKLHTNSLCSFEMEIDEQTVLTFDVPAKDTMQVHLYTAPAFTWMGYFESLKIKR